MPGGPARLRAASPPARRGRTSPASAVPAVPAVPELYGTWPRPGRFGGQVPYKCAVQGARGQGGEGYGVGDGALVGAAGPAVIGAGSVVVGGAATVEPEIVSVPAPILAAVRVPSAVKQ